jgi:rhodanese-related sulfurtransferase
MALQQNLEPADVARRLADHAIVLIDVREPDEFAAEHIHGALLYPLSTFDPKALPAPGDRKIVLHCGSGMRSAKALAICAGADVAVAGHVTGGIKAWKAAGLPVISTDRGTDNLREQR